MARTATPMKQNRTRHSQAFKNEALALAERIGVSCQVPDDCVALL